MSLSTSESGLCSDQFVKRSSKTLSVPSPWCFSLVWPRWVEVPSMPHCWGELLRRLVPLRAAGGTGEPRAPLGCRPANGTSCPALLLPGTEWCSGVWVSCPKHTIICFFPGCFWLLYLLSA